MQHFFDKNNLNPEQKSRWGSVEIEYNKIQEINVQNNFKALSAIEKMALMKETNCQTDEQLLGHLRMLNKLQGGGAQDEKSALFARLLEGRQPLIYPPPCSFSYPWYAVIEDQGPWEIFAPAQSVKDMLATYHENDKGLMIDHSVWKLLSIISNTEALITFGAWEDLGFMWKLSLDRVLCTHTVAYISSWHDTSLARITTLDQLKAEQLFHIEKTYKKLKLLNPHTKVEYTEEIIAQYGENYATGILATEQSAAEELLKQRLAKKLTPYPTAAEIQAEVKVKVQEYFDKGYSVDKKGNLYHLVWRLARVTPLGITKDIYI